MAYKHDEIFITKDLPLKWKQSKRSSCATIVEQSLSYHCEEKHETLRFPQVQILTTTTDQQFWSSTFLPGSWHLFQKDISSDVWHAPISQIPLTWGQRNARSIDPAIHIRETSPRYIDIRYVHKFTFKVRFFRKIYIQVKSLLQSLSILLWGRGIIMLERIKTEKKVAQINNPYKNKGFIQ